MPDTDFFRLPFVTADQALDQVREGAVLIDLRKAEKVAKDGRRVPGALVRDAFTFGHDDPLIQDDRRLIVFCQKGEEVGQFGCALLMVHGRDAAYVRGGLLALVEAGAGTVPAETAE